MAIYDGFFDAELDTESGTYDREYHAPDFTDYFGSFIGSGVCVYENPDSMRVTLRAGAADIAPGYLFIAGYWLKNDDIYTVPLPASGEQAVLAKLNMTSRMVELTAQAKTAPLPDDCLVLAYVDPLGAVEDTRADPELCGMIDAAGDLSAKVRYAVDYIDNQVEDRLAQAEADLAAQEARLDAKIAEVGAQVEKIAPPPVGTVKFTASAEVGEGWLRCDGSFVTEEDYPELVAALGKLTPGVEDYQELLGAETAGQISNICLQGGYAWAYLVEQRKLVGVSAAECKEIAVTGAESLVALASVDTVLSVCSEAVYLAQNNQNSNAFVLLECTSFAGNETEIAMQALDTSSLTVGLDMRDCVPHVVDVSGRKYMALGTLEETVNRQMGSSTYKDTVLRVKYISWASGDFSSASTALADIAWLDSTQTNTYANAKGAKRSARTYFSFTSKNADEILLSVSYLMYSTASSHDNARICFCVYSRMREIFGPVINYNYTAVSQVFSSGQSEYDEVLMGDYDPPNNIIPIAGGNEYLYRAEISGRKIKLTHGKYNPKTVFTFTTVEIQLPARARLFKESVAYASVQGLWFIFVGTGLLFSETLENGKWGYLDTQEMAGVITQFGCLDYDEDANALYISGVATTGFPKISRLQLPDLYNYANDGAWLPMISSDGVPAYIKAKEVE